MLWQKRVDEQALSLVLLILLFFGLLAACAGQPSAPDPAGTSTQDPPIPQLTEATHGIVDTTGTIPQSLLEQLRARLASESWRGDIHNAQHAPAHAGHYECRPSSSLQKETYT